MKHLLVKAREMSLVGSFLLIAMAPFFHFPFIVGTIVNAILVYSIIKFGWRISFLLGAIPSSIALLLQMLISVNLIFWIILANWCYVSLFAFFYKKKNFLVPVFLSSFAKAGILMGVSFVFISSSFALYFGTIQFTTAIFGGIIGYFFSKIKSV